MDIPLTLSEIKKLDKYQAVELYKKLNLRIPKGADLDFLRSNLRLVKITDPANGSGLYENSEDVLRSLEPTYKNTAPGENEYEDVDDFSSDDDSVSSKVTDSDNKGTRSQSSAMAVQGQRIPVITIPTFSGNTDECVLNFLKRFEKAAEINGWTDEQKKSYISLYLSGSASDRCDLYEAQNPVSTWQALKATLRAEYSPAESKALIMAQLNSRVQLPTEPLSHYVTDVEKLCARFDVNMAEETKCSHIVKGLSPLVLQQIAVLDNSSLARLRENLSRSDLSTVLLRHRLGLEEGSTSKTTSHLEDQVRGLSQMVQQLQVETRKNGYEHSDTRELHQGRGRSKDRRDYRGDYREPYDSPPRRDYRRQYRDAYDSPPRRDHSRPGLRRNDSRGRYPDESRRSYHGQALNRDYNGEHRPDYSGFKRDARGAGNRYEGNRYEGNRYEGNRDTQRSVRFQESPNKGVKCWNCGKFGHVSRNCSKN